MSTPFTVALREPRDRRSTGRADAVAAEVLAEPARFDELVEAMRHDDALVRMRAADAAEKVTRSRPDLLAPHAERLVDELALADQQEVRWHVAQMLPRLSLTTAQRTRAVERLRGWLADDRSRIVQACALEAIVDLSAADPAARRAALDLARGMTSHPSAAVRARARALVSRRPFGNR